MQLAAVIQCGQRRVGPDALAPLNARQSRRTGKGRTQHPIRQGLAGLGQLDLCAAQGGPGFVGHGIRHRAGPPGGLVAVVHHARSIYPGLGQLHCQALTPIHQAQQDVARSHRLAGCEQHLGHFARHRRIQRDRLTRGTGAQQRQADAVAGLRH